MFCLKIYKNTTENCFPQNNFIEKFDEQSK